jgi:hypothetical protein
MCHYILEDTVKKTGANQMYYKARAKRRKEENKIKEEKKKRCTTGEDIK